MTYDVDQVALDIARKYTPDNVPFVRSRLQVEIIGAITHVLLLVHEKNKKVIEQVNKVEGLIDEAGRLYHDCTRWAEEPSVYEENSSPSWQEVIDQGFNDLRDLIKQGTV